jgi:hypothetical protein
MTSISGTTSSPGSLGSYYAQLLAAKASADDGSAVDQSDTDTSLTSAEAQALTSLEGTGTSSDAGALSTLLGSSSGRGDTLSSLLGNSFTDTNSLLRQLSALATGSSSTDGSATDGSTADDPSTAPGTNATSQQLKIASLLANMFQSEQNDFLSILL